MGAPLSTNLFKGLPTAPKDAAKDGDGEDGGDGDDDAGEEHEQLKHPDESSLYSLKEVKVLYMNDGKWISHGVGNLMIQEAGQNKYKVVIRADNASANYLLNTMLYAGIPIGTNGPRGVTITCIAFPPLTKKCGVCEVDFPSGSADCKAGCYSTGGCTLPGKEGQKPKPTSFALKIASPQEATELFNKLQHYLKLKA